MPICLLASNYKKFQWFMFGGVMLGEGAEIGLLHDMQHNKLRVSCKSSNIWYIIIFLAGICVATYVSLCCNAVLRIRIALESLVFVCVSVRKDAQLFMQRYLFKRFLNSLMQ